MNIKPIQEAKVRNWAMVPFSGELMNTQRFSNDIGISYFLVIEKFKEECQNKDVAHILAPVDSLGIMAQETKDLLTKLIRDLAAKQPPTTEEFNALLQYQKALRDEVERLKSLGIAASKAIGILKGLCTGNVQDLIRSIEETHNTDHIKALNGILRDMKDKFQGKPYMRKEQLQALVDAVGIALDVPGLAMLVSQMSRIYQRADAWLTIDDGHGGRKLCCDSVPSFPDEERTRHVLRRISDTAQALTPYRSLIADQAETKTCTEIMENVLTLVRKDVRSLDSENTHMHALTTSTPTQDLQHSAYLAGYELYPEEDNKRRRLAPGLTPGYAQKPPVKDQKLKECFYWNGQTCDYEDKTGNKCDWSDHHMPGMSTFKFPFVPRGTAERQDFVTWRKERDGGSSSSPSSSSYK